MLTISADGAVPIAFRVEDGNTADDVTHIPTWDGLRALVGRADFLYVADCKLANREAMGHIAGNGGRFVTILPHSRKQDAEFRDWIWHNTPDWTEAHRRPGEPDDVWPTTLAPTPSAEGYPIIWVRASAKIGHDAEARRARIAKGIAALDELNNQQKRVRPSRQDVGVDEVSILGHDHPRFIVRDACDLDAGVRLPSGN